MNKGVEILLERMKSNPEEFIAEANYGESKWSAIVSFYKSYLDEEDAKILMDAWQENTKKVMQERFTQKVMKELLDPKERMEQAMAPYQSATGSGGVTLGQSSIQNQAYNNLTLGTNALGALGQATWATTTATGTISAQQSQASLTLGDTTLNESTLSQMLATHRAMREEEKAKKHQTLFGKLYNYLGSNK